jgi:hypothetical protein
MERRRHRDYDPARLLRGQNSTVSHLRLEVRYRDGHVTKDSRERIDPGAHPTRGYDVWTVPVEGVRVAGPQTPNPYSGDTVDVVESAVLTYSDERGIARYEQRVRPSTVVGTTPVRLAHQRRGAPHPVT